MKSFYSLVIFTVLSFGLSIGTRDLGLPVSQKIQPRAIASIDAKLAETKPGAEAQDATLDESCGPYEIMNETFEASWPTALWNVVDLSNDGYDRKWDDDNYRPHSGNLAAWPARGGVNGRDPIGTNNDYFNNMNTRMVYGPFDLRDAAQAEVSFWLWRQMESCCDYLVLEVSGDNGTFQEVGRWTGNAGWEQKNISLNAYIGDSTVWVAWRFYSDRRNVFDGPWVDDILLRKYVAGDVTVNGTLSYFNRYDISVGAPYTAAYLWDKDIGAGNDDYYGTTYTGWNGFFSFDPVPNVDDDDNDGNFCLDLYVIWKTDIYDIVNSRRRVINFSDDVYQWTSNVHYNVLDGVVVIDHVIQPDDTAREAMWIFQDLRNAWKDVYSNSNIDPGSATVLWENNVDCYIHLDPFFEICNSFYYDSVFGPFIFISDKQADSADTVVHETGHRYMDNANGFWWWYSDCWDHELFNVQDQGCAWSEGWGDFFALFVNSENQDTCYDFGIGPCGQGGKPYEDLEAHNYNDDPNIFHFGDSVEGRVAGAFYDLYDVSNEPDYDSANFGFDLILDLAFRIPYLTSFNEFWENWIPPYPQSKHDTVRAIYQNTINYDTAPHFTEDSMIRYTIKNQNRYRVLDLWYFSDDNESAYEEMIYEIVDQSSLQCGTKITDNRWIDIEPAPDFEGSCYYTIKVSDTILPDQFDLQVNVVLPEDLYYFYLPIVIE